MSKTKTPPPSGSERQQHSTPQQPSAIDDRLVSTGDAAAVDQFLRDAPAACAWLRSVVETNARSPLPAAPPDLGYFAAAVEVIRGHADGRAMLRAVVARAERRHAGDEATRDRVAASPPAPANGHACPIAELHGWIQGVAQRIRLVNSRDQPSRRTGPAPRATAESQAHPIVELRDWIRRIVPRQVHGASERLQVQPPVIAKSAADARVGPGPDEQRPIKGVGAASEARRPVIEGAEGGVRGPRRDWPKRASMDRRARHAGPATPRRSPTRSGQGRRAAPDKGHSHVMQNRWIATMLKALFVALQPTIPQGPMGRSVVTGADRRKAR